MFLSQFALGRGELKKPKFALILLILGFLIHTPIISAQEDQMPVEDPLRAAELALTFSDNTSVPNQISGPSVWSVIRMILVLALVAAAIYGIVFLFKKASKQAPSNDPFLKVLANTHLGGNRYAHVISVGSKAWLVGSCDGGVNLIGEVQDKEIIDAMLLEDSRKSEQAPGGLPDFLSILRRQGIRAQPQTPSVDEIRKRRERLKDV